MGLPGFAKSVHPIFVTNNKLANKTQRPAMVSRRGRIKITKFPEPTAFMKGGCAVFKPFLLRIRKSARNLLRA